MIRRQGADVDLQSGWERAVKKTEVVRFRIQPLHTFRTTPLPYIFLAESSVNAGDTVVREGQILVEKPLIFLPPHHPQFEGFDFEKVLDLRQEELTNFLLVRGVRFPSFKYQNVTLTLDVYEGRLGKAAEHYSELLRKKEDTATGLILGPEDLWSLSVLVFVGAQVVRSADGDIRNLLDPSRGDT